MQEEDFKTWLEAGGATAETSRNTRGHALRTIENNLPNLGSVHTTLDDPWRDDQFVQ